MRPKVRGRPRVCIPPYRLALRVISRQALKAFILGKQVPLLRPIHIPNHYKLSMRLKHLKDMTERHRVAMDLCRQASFLRSN